MWPRNAVARMYEYLAIHQSRIDEYKLKYPHLVEEQPDGVRNIADMIQGVNQAGENQQEAIENEREIGCRVEYIVWTYTASSALPFVLDWFVSCCYDVPTQECRFFQIDEADSTCTEF